MNKKTIILGLILVFCVGGLLTLLKYFNIIEYFNSKSGSLTTEQIINKSIKIQYRGGNKKELDEVFTPDFIKQIDSNPDFYKKKIFYIIDKKFMESYKNLNENESMVSVKVEESSGSYIQIITLTKDSSGKYLISKIEYDI